MARETSMPIKRQLEHWFASARSDGSLPVPSYEDPNFRFNNRGDPKYPTVSGSQNSDSNESDSEATLVQSNSENSGSNRSDPDDSDSEDSDSEDSDSEDSDSEDSDSENSDSDGSGSDGGDSKRIQIAKSDEKWATAKNWNALLRLNKKWIIDSKEGSFASTPYIRGPLDCLDTTVMRSMIKLHRRGLMVTGGDGCWSGKLRSHWYCRSVPQLDLILRDDGETTDAFLNKLREDSDMVLHVTSSKGELVGGSPNPFVCFGMVRTSAKRRWRITESAEAPVSLEDFSLEKHPVMRKRNFLICRVFLKLDNDFVLHASDKEFLERVKRVDIFEKVFLATKELEDW